MVMSGGGGGGSNNVCWNGIVDEALNSENYSNWSTLVESYLVGEGLWEGVVEKKKSEEEKNSKTGKAKKSKEETKSEDEKSSKNGKALHAIKLSCGKDALGKIREVKNAEEAWNKLRVSYSENLEAHRQNQGPDNDDIYNHMVRIGLLKDVKAMMNISPEVIFSRSSDGSTVLHTAVSIGLEDDELIKFVNLGKQRLLKMQDNNGYTALALAVELTDDNHSIVEYMVNIGGKELLSIRTKDKDKDKGEIPLLLAAAKHHAKITNYLFSVTPLSTLLESNFLDLLFSRCINAQFFEIAAKILREPESANKLLSPASNQPGDVSPSYALALTLAGMPSAFESGDQLNWWQKFIYNHLTFKKPFNNVLIKIVSDLDPEVGTNTKTNALAVLSGIQKIITLKKNHSLLFEILEYLRTKVVNGRQSFGSEDKFSVEDAMLRAAKNGNYNFIKIIAKVDQELLYVMDRNGRGILAHAILNRQEKVFKLIISTRRQNIKSNVDVFKNNMLHLAGELGPSSYLVHMSNAALQLQRELQWFKGVERIVPESYQEDKNANGEVPHEVFTKTHAPLLKDAQQWAKETSSSFILVGTLIITIMFAAAFTVPGGFNSENGSDKGLPVFLGKNIFNIFIVADAIALITSSSSVLMFIGILTSYYAENDFYRSLPLKLLFGLLTLFLSVTSMMVAFCAALALLLQGYHHIVIAAIWLALLPIFVFIPSLVSSTPSGLNEYLRLQSHVVHAL
ncbi:hypothetical protein VNO77_20874 [Canavalia gladiata]|uniref:PGG domain-containing protein n=1 Tax=Canavalia gladiata TaxID=3824 RepID=A0AAN9LV42_CANGL